MDLQLYCLQDIKRAPLAFQIDTTEETCVIKKCQLQNKEEIKQLVLFTFGQWAEDDKTNITIDIFAVTGTDDKEKICTLNKAQRCFQWTAKELPAGISKRHKMTLEARVTSEAKDATCMVRVESSPVSHVKDQTVPTPVGRTKNSSVTTPVNQTENSPVTMLAGTVLDSPVSSPCSQLSDSLVSTPASRVRRGISCSPASGVRRGISCSPASRLKNSPLSRSPVLTKSPLVTNEGELMKILNETTPVMELSGEETSPLPVKAARKRKPSDDSTPFKQTPRRQKMAMRALIKESSPKSALQEVKSHNGQAGLKTSIKTKKRTQCVDLSARVPKPSNRWGHSLTMVNTKQAVLIGGQGDKQLSRDSIWILDPEIRTWKNPTVSTESSKPEFRIGHSATYDPTMRCIYIYGGSKNAKWFHDVHMFDLDENKWTLVKASGKAPTRAYHSTSLYRHELWIFGGVFPRPDPQPDGCDNEVHIFSPVMENWYKPIVTGDKPQPRSGHSATLINDQLVVFGGWDFPFCYNDLFILDLTTVDWSSPQVHGQSPKPRSWHASCGLSNNRIFIHGGYDGDVALYDAHIFDLDTKSWQQIALDNAPSARAGHTCLPVTSAYENSDEDEIIVFGGGDNEGSYFNDMLSFYVPFLPELVSE